MPTREYKAELLKENILLAGCGHALLKAIADDVHFFSFAKTTQIFQQGEAANGLYFIPNGTVQIYGEHNENRMVLSHANANHLFGEFLLCGNSLRSTYAVALTDCDLLFWPIESFGRLLTRFPEEFKQITSRLVRRLSWNQTMQALRLSPLFVGLPEDIARDLINHMTIKSVPANTLLLKQNDLAEDMCIVINGQFQVSRNDENRQPEIIAHIGRGETVGEMGLICGSQRAADVISLRDSTVAYLNRAAFEGLLKQHPVEVNQTFVRSLLNHLGKKSDSPATGASTLALINLSPELDAEAFCTSLSNSLQRHGFSRILTSNIVDQAFMRDEASQCDFGHLDNDSLVQWLSEQELIHQHIVYVADPTLTHWTRRCLRQADHVLFLVSADSEPTVSQLENQILAELHNRNVKKTLVILHSPSASTPLSTSRWLQARTLDDHHHVRRRSDFGRLARFLTGNALGLVLGGGAARGFAHIGVLKALKELDIAIDMVGGNSMGAIIAAEYALHWDERQMLEKTRKLCIKGDNVTLPMVSLFSGKAMTTGLRYLFDDLYIEDLWMPFFCVSCNISRATLMTHRQGALLSALLSSNAPPGLFPPQVRDGDLLVDGALLNNLPVDVMRGLNPGGQIIAVNVNQREDLLHNTNNVGGVSGWQILWSRLNPFAPSINLPGMVQILTRASMIGGLAQQKKMHEGLADLYLQPPVNEFSLTGYRQAQAIADAGYHYAKEQLETWLQSLPDHGQTITCGSDRGQ